MLVSVSHIKQWSVCKAEEKLDMKIEITDRNREYLEFHRKCVYKV